MKMYREITITGGLAIAAVCLLSALPCYGQTGAKENQSSEILGQIGKVDHSSAEFDGAKELTLIVTEGGNDPGGDHASWADTYLSVTSNAQVKSPVDYVNPLIGSGGPQAIEYGGMQPGVTVPFGMTQWVAMTRLNKISRCSYRYEDSAIGGFIGTRQPAVWMGDYGQVGIMPGLGQVETAFAARSIKFSHDEETARPDYYSVKMRRNDELIHAQMVATCRASLFNFTFSGEKQPHLVIDASYSEKVSGNQGNNQHDGWIKINPDKAEITGWNSDRHCAHLGPDNIPDFKGYFVIQSDTPIQSYGTYQDTDKQAGQTEASGDHVGGFITFDKGVKNVRIRIGTSLISIEQARENLKREIDHWEIDKTAAESRQVWNQQLSKIVVEGQDEDALAIFYTGIFRAHLYPRIMSEYGRYYSAFDDKVHAGVSYSDFCLWDTFRGVHPLFTLTAPERVGGMITALLQMYEQGGWLPKWPNPTYTGIMIGTHADSVIADAYVKGLRDFDLNLAYEACYKNAMTPQKHDKERRWADRARNGESPEARGGLSWYKELGYVPLDKTAESVSRTIEFSFNDFCVAQLAKAVNQMDDYEYLMKRSKNYKNVYKNGFVNTRRSTGEFTETNVRNGFCEGSPWTYQFGVMHDIPGMIETIGGSHRFMKKLDENFDKRHYRHDNEPGHHYTYLYNFCGAPWKTQEKVREMALHHYANAMDGFSGNEDCGAMSTWYTLSSMGFYSVTPGTDRYSIGSPMWDKVTINIGQPYKKAQFTISCKNQSKENKYIQSATLNGKALNKPVLLHSDIVKGGELEFLMGPKPNKSWGL